MSVERLLERFQARGGVLRVVNGQLKYRLPEGAVDRMVLEETLKRYKPALLAHATKLEGLYATWLPTVDTLYQNEATKETALALEQAMVNAVIELDEAAMMTAIEQATQLIVQKN